MNRLSINELVSYVENKTKLNDDKDKELDIIVQEKKINPLDINKSEIIEFTSDLKIIFDKYIVMRKGTLINNLSYLNNIDCSSYLTLYQSLIYNIRDSTFLSKEYSYQETYIFEFIEELKKSLHKLPSGKDKKNLFNMMILTDDINQELIKYIANYLTINLFIVDIFNNTIKLANDEYRMEYKNTYILKHNNIYEPLYSNDEISVINYLDMLKIKIYQPKIKEDIKEDINEETANYYREDSENEKQNLNELKMDELKKMAKNLKISLSVLINKKRVNKDKKTLIAEIKNAQKQE